MATCPNKNLQEWKDLVEAKGENIAYDLWDRFDGNVPSSEVSLQLDSIESSKTSSDTLDKVKEVIKSMGASMTSLSAYAKGNPDINTDGVNGLADLTHKVIAISEGKEDVALTEEMVHVATSILEQTNPELVSEMISKIGNFQIYKDTLAVYRKNPSYQLANGKPNIRKIKKEAVDKLLVEVIINQNEGTTEFPELLEESNRSWVRAIWEKILSLFNKAYKNSNISIFETAADTIINEEFGSVSDIKDTGEIYFQISDAQKSIQNRILETSKLIHKETSDEAVPPILLDTEEANNWYVKKNADGTTEPILKRVTDRVKKWYQTKFRDKTFTDKENIFNEFKRENGIKYHNFFEEIHGRYFDTEGVVRKLIPKRPHISDFNDAQIYNKLETYYVKLIKNHTKNGVKPVAFAEAVVFDPKLKEAGTIDLLIVDSDGKTHIYDWKFMTVAAGSRDVAWFKQGAYKIQLKRYSTILKDFYGVKEMGNNRAIPIIFDIKRKKKFKSKEVTYIIKDVVIGDVDSSKITELKLLPVSAEDESTGEEALDNLLKDLNNVHSKISSLKVVDDAEKEFKKDRLNIIKDAIRVIQGTLNVEPLIEVISLMKKEGENLINDYEMIFKDKKSNDKSITNKQLSDYSESLQDYMAISSVFGNIGDTVKDLIYPENMLENAITPKQKENARYRKSLIDQLNTESSAIRNSEREIKKIAGEFADKFIGIRNLVSGLLGINKELKSIGSIFRGVSELSIPALSVLHKVVTNTKAEASRVAYSRVQKLTSIRDVLAKRSGDFRTIVSPLYQKDSKGNSTNKLIYKFNRSFYDGIDENAKDGDQSVKYIKDNINIKEYVKEAGALLTKRYAHFDKTYVDTALIQRLINEERNKYDINSEDFNGFNNYILKKHPNDKHISKEYKQIEQDEDLFALYKYIEETNQKANEVGYIENKVKNTFLPFVRKGTAESLAWDVSLSAVQRLGDSLKVNIDDVGYGTVDKITKEIINTIPKYYTSDFTLLSSEESNKRIKKFISENGRQPTNEERAELKRDYSHVSEDLFKNLMLYTTHLEQYKYLSDVEGQLTLVKKIESFKQSYKATRFGDVSKKDGDFEKVETNEVNTKLYTNFLNALLYDQKYPISNTDVPLHVGKALSYGGKLINWVTGKEVFKESETPMVSSMMKTIDAGNRYFQLKTLGFSIIAGAANFFGTTIQMSTQSGNYFKSREYAANALKLLGNRFDKSDERELFIQLVDTFMPLKDDPNYEKIKQAGMTSLTRQSFSDILMVFMRMPEFHVEKSIFLTLLQNSMVGEDGKIVNIREFVKSKYSNRYKNTSEYRQVSKQIEAEIKELKQTKSIDVTKQLVNGKLSIPGLDLNNQVELQRLTNLSRRIARNATGSMSNDDINVMTMSQWGRSAMVFKGWIPKLVDTRFGEFRKISDDFSVEINEDGLTTGEKYDIGRARLFGYVIGTSIRDKTFNIRNILKFNEKGAIAIEKMYEDFAQRHMKRTGIKLDFDVDKNEYINFITKDEFTDLIRTNLRNQIKELGILITLISATLAVPPPEEDMSKSEKNFYRFSQKIINRFVQELSFFYNPAEYQNLLSGNMFPVLGIAGDIEKFFNHFLMETTGIDVFDLDLSKEEVFKKAQPIKYGAKMVPLAKELLNWGAIIDDDFAKDFDITIQSSNRGK